MSALRGKRVVITRAQHQADGLARLLAEQEAIPLSYPCLEIHPPTDSKALEGAIARLVGGDFDWVILTSANTVAILGETLQRLSPPPQYAVIGPATAQAMSDLGLNVAPISRKIYTANRLLEALPAISGAQILLPQSELADSDLARLLTERGAHVTAVSAYTMKIGKGGIHLATALHAGQIDVITLASPSAFHNLLTRLKDEGGDPNNLRKVALACIGSTTAQAVQTGGFNPAITAESHTVTGLIDALNAYFTQQETPHP